MLSHFPTAKAVPFLLSLFAAVLTAGPAPAQTASANLKAVPFSDVHIDDSFWTPRLKTNQTVTVEANLLQCERTGRINNFAVAGKLVPGKHKGLLFDDSDLYKVIEGIAYTLTTNRDPNLEKRTDAIIDKIAAAQQPDGYLNTYYTLVKPQERWKNIQHGHELYCAGHLIEAAVAYHQATGKRKLLDVARKLADHILTVFGPGKRIDTCGHEEIELALVRLYRATGEKKYLDQAKYFLDVRGRADQRKLFGEYAQDHKPVREQTEVTGHAVRAMYLYCGMADVAALTGDKGLMNALERIWRDVVDRKMYVTGGIGPSAHNEGFTVPYDLPNDSAYAETCAAVGMALWNHRMFLMTGDCKYADVLERVVYNGLLSGVSLAGDKFFYVNPLGSVGKHHRQQWFDCACCPDNVLRYVAGIGDRVYAHRGNEIWTVLYASNTATISLKDGKVKLTQATTYPWDGKIKIKIEPERPFFFTLHLRIPGWCRSVRSLTENGRVRIAAAPGIAVGGPQFISTGFVWKAGDAIELELDMPVERVHAHPKVKADVGRVAIQRGPIVYCLEGADNGGQVRNLVLPKDAKLTAAFEKDLLRGVVAVRGEGLAVTRGENGKLVTTKKKFQAVPYSTWDNRQPGQMVVWLPESPDLAEIPGEQGVKANGALIQASHVNPTDTLAALNDGGTPKSSGDHDIPRMTWWDHKGTAEWLGYRFDKPCEITEVGVYWFDDAGIGRCRVPAEWHLFWKDSTEWKPVKLTGCSRYGTALDQFNRVTFEPVRTRALRMEVRLQDGFSGGVLKWTTAGPK
jgi:DUF1680 family protein